MLEIIGSVISNAAGSGVGWAVGWCMVGLSFLAFMVVDDLRHGRTFQKRDIHVVFYWPVILMVILILGLFEFSRITSSEDGKVLKRPENWI